MEDFGKGMRVMRALRGMSQRDLEAATSIPNSYLSQVERGRWVLTESEIATVKAALGWDENVDKVLGKLEEVA